MTSPEFITEHELFEAARTLAKHFTQKQIGTLLNVSQPSVQKMLSGNSSYLKLAIRFISDEIKLQSVDGKPVRYYRVEE